MRNSPKERAELRREFALGTSCHGLSQIYQSKNEWIKVLWIIIFLSTFSLLVWQVVDRFQAYFLYDTSIQTSEVSLKSLVLPAITICNINRYFDLSSEERQALNTLSVLYDFESENTSRIESAVQFFKKQGVNDNFSDYLISKTWELNYPKTLFYCWLGEEECNQKNFSSTFSSAFGQCWTFISDLPITKRGMSNGIHILLNASQDGYSENLYFGHSVAGFLFRIHANYEPSEVEYFGQTVGVGNWAFVAIQKEERSNMYAPWGQCNPNQESLNYYSPYSVAACYKECIDKYVIDNCGCRDPPSVGHLLVRNCTAEEIFRCAAKARSNFEATTTPESDCGCFKGCNEVTYSSSVSYATNPSQVAATDISKVENVTLEYLRENYVGLTVYYSNIGRKTIVESKAISESALLSDIGGQLGLWIGVSVITLFEFFEFLTKIILSLSKKQDAGQKENECACDETQSNDEPEKL